MFSLLEEDAAFASWYTELLAQMEFASFFWEHPPLSTASYDAAAEFSVVDGPELATLRPDCEPFRSQFEQIPSDDVVAFPNLGGDAVLLAPRPIGSPEAYAHLASFVRRGPASQVHCLWRHTARVVRETVGAKPTWLSTAGMGVAWVHIRLDSRPKYYRYVPYKTGRR
jgi:hypothetical protein